MAAKFIVITMALISSACVIAPRRAEVALFSNDQSPTPALVAPEKIGVYRTVPATDTFSELGVISFKTRSVELAEIYDQLRKDAATHGADAIVGVKIKNETHDESEAVQKCETKMDCSPDGTSCSSHEECHTEWVTQAVTTYTTQGSMIRRNR